MTDLTDSKKPAQEKVDMPDNPDKRLEGDDVRDNPDKRLGEDDEQDHPEPDWTAAMAEQAGAERATDIPGISKADEASGVGPAPALFQPLASRNVDSPGDIDMIMDIPVQMSVELGRTRMTIKSILQLGQGSVVELDGLAGEPMDIYVNGYLIAQGEVVVVDEKYGIRVTDIITPSDRINRLNNRR